MPPAGALPAADAEEAVVLLFGGPALRIGGAARPLGPQTQARAFAALAVNPRRVVPVATMVDRVWGSAPPQTARRSLQAHLSRLRGILDTVEVPVDIARRGAGYVLDVDPLLVDLHRFRHLAERAVQDGDRAEESCRLLDQAMRLYSAPALVSLDGGWTEEFREQVESEVVATAVRWGRAACAVGRAEEVAPRLRPLLMTHPLVEPLAEVLLLALHSCGLTAEGLQLYREVRQRLVTELGVEPGPQLREVHDILLRDDVAAPARVNAGESPAGWSKSSGPRHLPAPVASFVGRDEEQEFMDRWSSDEDDRPAPPLSIIAVCGTAGVGKTALAIHWAHRHRGRFPDGELFLDLRGYDPGSALSPGDALARMLAALGLPGPLVPAGLEERSAALRDLVADRRMLMLLDNAADTAQVRPLLPGTGSCQVIVTSRDSLAGLVAREGARRLQLGTLAAGQATALMSALVGRRAAQGDLALGSLVDACGGLPLAVRIAAEVAASRPADSLDDLARELAGIPVLDGVCDHAGTPSEGPRLDLLDETGDERTAIRSVFSWSYRHLPEQAARVFRLIGVHHGPLICATDVAALGALTLESATQVMGSLVQASLVQQANRASYRVHDLLASYARELATRTDGTARVQEYRIRLLDHEAASITAAMDAAYPAERQRRPNPPGPGGTAADFTGPDAARDWLHEHLDTLLTAVSRGAEWQLHRHVLLLAGMLYRHLDLSGLLAESIQVNTLALHSARAVDDKAAQAGCLNNIGAVHWRQGAVDEAVQAFTDAVELAGTAGASWQEARARGNLGNVLTDRGQLRLAAEHLERSVRISEELGILVGRVHAGCGLSAIHKYLGEESRALELAHAAAELAEGSGDPFLVCNPLLLLGEIHERTGPVQSRRYAEQALVAARQGRHTHIEAYALSLLGGQLALSADPAEVRQGNDRLAEATEAFDRLNNRAGAALTQVRAGEALIHRGQCVEAVECLTAALDSYAALGHVLERPRALEALGRAELELGRTDRARGHLQEASELATRIEDPHWAARAQVALEQCVDLRRR